MVQDCRRDGGWVSVELAIITPVLLFLVSIFVTLLGVCAQRVNFSATLRNCAIAASRLESSTALATMARDSLPGLRNVVVDVATGDGDDVRVTLQARLSLPAPLRFVALHWSESLVAHVSR